MVPGAVHLQEGWMTVCLQFFGLSLVSLFFLATFQGMCVWGGDNVMSKWDFGEFVIFPHLQRNHKLSWNKSKNIFYLGVEQI